MLDFFRIYNSNVDIIVCEIHSMGFIRMHVSFVDRFTRENVIFNKYRRMRCIKVLRAENVFRCYYAS